MLELEGLDADATSVLVGCQERCDACYTALIEDKIMCMFGITTADTNDNVGIVWLLGSEDIKKNTVQFIRESRPRFLDLVKPYDMVCNKVHEDNKLHHRWLKFLGFKFISHKPPFYEFARIT